MLRNLITAGLCICAGCSWGHNARLQYAAGADEKIDADIAAHTKCAKAELTGLTVEYPALAEHLAPVQGRLEKVEDLATQGVQRARLGKLFHGTPPDLKVTLGDDRDKAEVAGFGGIAAERAHKRWCKRTFWKRFAKGTAEFIIAFTKPLLVEIPKAFIPWYVWWALGVAGVIALVILLYALYQRVTVRRKDRAIDQFWSGVEQLPKPYREMVGRGRPDLQIEHIPRNERHRQEVRESEEEKQTRFRMLSEKIRDSSPLPGSRTGPDFLAAGIPADQDRTGPMVSGGSGDPATGQAPSPPARDPS